MFWLQVDAGINGTLTILLREQQVQAGTPEHINLFGALHTSTAAVLMNSCAQIS